MTVSGNRKAADLGGGGTSYQAAAKRRIASVKPAKVKAPLRAERDEIKGLMKQMGIPGGK